MPEVMDVGWVKMASESTGRDHLGLQSQSVHVYSQLFDAITNITPKARYYSFYCWLTKWLSEDHPKDFKNHLRRADVLFGLISLSHGDQLNEKDKDKHNTGILGYNTLKEFLNNLNIAKGKTFKLSDITGEDPNGKRYLKSKFGGFGQNYLGPLQQNGLINRIGSESFELTSLGVVFAKAFEETGFTKNFIDLIEKNEVCSYDLQGLHNLCMCNISLNPNEKRMIEQFLFQGQGFLPAGGVPRRRESFKWIHWLIEQGMTPSIQSFRGVAYSSYSEDGIALEHNLSSEKIRETWADYVLNELYSVSLQGMFWSILSSDLNTYQTDIVQWVDKFIHENIDLGVEFENTQSSGDWLESVENKLPEKFDWKNENSEIKLAERIISQAKKNQNYHEVLASSIKLYLSLCIRLSTRKTEIFSDIENKDFFDKYPTNLKKLHGNCKNLKSNWWSINGVSWLKQIIYEDVLQVHLQVALKKLNEGQHTFCFFKDELGITIRHCPKPVFTMPRFNNAIRMLVDLDYLQVTNDDVRVNSIAAAIRHD